MARDKNKLTLLKCPQCGSNNVQTLDDDKVQCKNCKSIFVYESNKQVYNTTYNTYHNYGGNANNIDPKKVLIPMLVFLILFFGFLILRPSKRSNLLSKDRVVNCAVVVTNNGPQLWKITSKSTSTSDEVIPQKLVMEDLFTGKVVGSSEFTVSKEQYGGYGEIWISKKYFFYVSRRGNSVKAFYTANGKPAWDEKTFRQAYPNATADILSIYSTRATNDYYHVKLKDATDLYYYPDMETIIERSSDDASLPPDRDTIFFSFGSKKSSPSPDFYHFFKIKRSYNPASIKDMTAISEQWANDYIWHKGWMKVLNEDEATSTNSLWNQTPVAKSERPVFTEMIPDKKYFKPKLLFEDGKRVVITYQEDADESGPYLLQGMDSTGKVLFTIIPEGDLKPLQEMLSSRRLDSRPAYYNNKLYLWENKYSKYYIWELDLATGKIRTMN